MKIGLVIGVKTANGEEIACIYEEGCKLHPTECPFDPKETRIKPGMWVQRDGMSIIPLRYDALPTKVNDGNVEIRSLVTLPPLWSEHTSRKIGLAYSADVEDVVIDEGIHLEVGFAYDATLQCLTFDTSRQRQRKAAMTSNTMWLLREDGLTAVTEGERYNAAKSAFESNPELRVKLKSVFPKKLLSLRQSQPEQQEGVVVCQEGQEFLIWCKKYNFLWGKVDDVPEEYRVEVAIAEWVKFGVLNEKHLRLGIPMRAVHIVPGQGPTYNKKTTIDGQPTTVEELIEFKRYNNTLKVHVRVEFDESRSLPLPPKAGFRVARVDGFFEAVAVESKPHEEIQPYRSGFDASIVLLPPPLDPSEKCVWRVEKFIFEGKEHAISGYMSLIGQGKWQRVRQKQFPLLRQNMRKSEDAPRVQPNAAVNGTIGWGGAAVPVEADDVDTLPVLTKRESKLAHAIEFQRVIATDKQPATIVPPRNQPVPSGMKPVIQPTVTTMPLDGPRRPLSDLHSDHIMRSRSYADNWTRRGSDNSRGFADRGSFFDRGDDTHHAATPKETLGVVFDKPRNMDVSLVWTPEGIFRIRRLFEGGSWLKVRYVEGKEEAEGEVVEEPGDVYTRYIPSRTYRKPLLVITGVGKVLSQTEVSVKAIGNISLPSRFATLDPTKEHVVELVLKEDGWMLVAVHDEYRGTHKQLFPWFLKNPFIDEVEYLEDDPRFSAE